MRWPWLLLLAIGCRRGLDVPHDGGVDAAAIADQATTPDLAGDMASACNPLAGLLGLNMQVTLPAQTISSTATSWCIHMTADNLVGEVLIANAPAVAGSVSGLHFSLWQLDDTQLADGSDVVVGNTAPQTVAEVQWSVTAPVERDVVLRAVSTDGTTHTTDVHVGVGDLD
jgi:hypothetical protein